MPNKNNYSVPIRLRNNAAEKTYKLASLLETSIEKAANKLLGSILDEAISNTEKFLSKMDSENKKTFLKIYDGTLEQLNKRGKNEKKWIFWGSKN